MKVVVLPPDRVARWIDNFEARHGGATMSVDGGALNGVAEDGSRFAARLPFSRDYAGVNQVSAFVAAGEPPTDWGILLVRKGGFAIARMAGTQISASKVGQRHVQGRTKAGGQSQQRFARRRANQARVAYEAAAEHAVRLIGDAGAAVVGGDAPAIAEVLQDPRLAGFRSRVVGSFLTVPDPRRSVLEAACGDAQAIRIEVVNH